VDGEEKLKRVQLVTGAGADGVEPSKGLDIELGRILFIAADLAELQRPLAEQRVDLGVLAGRKNLKR
jgi:hypothetical protein